MVTAPHIPLDAATSGVVHLDFKLNDYQDDFLHNGHRYAGLFAGIGSGKTFIGCLKALMKAITNSGSTGLIAAPTYPMLRDVTKKTFFEICPRELILYQNDTENWVQLRCLDGGVAEVYFRSASDADSLRGPNLLWFYGDEAGLWHKEAWLILIERIRAGDPKQQQGWLTGTPKGYNWCYELFGPQATDPEYYHRYAETKDNQFLSDEFVSSVYRQFGDSTFALQELSSKFVAAEGLVYGDLFDPKDVAQGGHIGYFPFDERYSVDLAWDFGFPNPEAVLAIQQDGAGNVYIIDEVYRMNTLTEDIVAEIRSKVWFDKVGDAVCDDARPDSILRLGNLGVPARPAKKGKVADGIQIVRSLLSKNASTKTPILHIDRKCEHLLKEFGLYRWAERKNMQEDWKETPVKMYDHALDALRYWAGSKWKLPSVVIPTERKAHKPKRRVMAYQLLGRKLR